MASRTHPRASWTRRWLVPLAAILTMVGSLTAVAPAQAAMYDQLAKLLAPAPIDNGRFGRSVAVSGNTIVVGEAGVDPNPGAVYVYTNNAGAVTRQATLTVSGSVQLGFAVAISGDTIVVAGKVTQGAGTASRIFVFTKPASGWVDAAAPDAILSGTTGYLFPSLSVSGDTIVAGISQGVVYVFSKPPGGWASTNTQTATLTKSTSTATDSFGDSVAVSGDTIVVGAPNGYSSQFLSGRAFLYVKPPGGWANANETVILDSPTPTQVERFGDSVAIDGDTVVIGASPSSDPAARGAAYVVTKPAAGWSSATPITATTRLTASNGVVDDQFGVSVGVSGGTVVVGAPKSDTVATDSGSAYVYLEPSNGWTTMTEQKILKASDAAYGDDFGSSVAVSGGLAVAGAQFEDTDTTTTNGAAYVYSVPASPSPPTQVSATRGDGQVTVSFTPPTYSGSAAITEYQYSTDAGATWVSADPDITASPFTITGLTNGTAYNIKVRAVNADGMFATASAGSVTPCAPPGTTSVTATPGDRIIDVVATATAGGCAITDYQYSLNGESWTSSGDTDGTFTINGLTNGTSYALKVRAVNDVGNGAESQTATVTPGRVPTYPRNVSVTAGDASAQVTFTPPSDTGGLPITNYEYSLNDGSNWVTPDPAQTASPLSITGLTNGTTYDLRLRAVNAIGAGSDSASVAFTPYGEITAPTIDAAFPGDGSVEIYFTPGSDGGSTIRNYEYNLGSGWVRLNPAQPNSPVVIDGLTNGTQYTITLRAVTAAGTGAASEPITVVPLGAPSAPTNVSATPGNGQAVISFTAPSDTGGPPIDNYQYRLNDGSWRSLNPPDTTSPITITGLTNGTEYRVRIRAFNGGQYGTASTSVYVTPSTIPAAPTGLVATPGDQSASIAFTPGADGGAPIRNYEYSTNSGTDWTALSPADTTSPVTVRGLTNGVAYQVLLRAVNDSGAGAASLPVSVTPRQVPGAPTALAADAGDQKATVYFSAPASTGGSAITGYQYSVDGGTWTDSGVVASPVTVSSLSNGTEYSIRLRAVNAAGAGPASSGVLVTPLTVPDAPTISSVYGADSFVEVLYSPGASDGGSQIIGYEYTTDGGTTWSDPVPALGGFMTITGLTNGTQYTVALRAVNAAGTSSASASKTVTPKTTPSAPLDLVAIPGNGTARIEFTAPDDGGSAITGYQYQLNGREWRTPIDRTTASPLDIRELTNGTEYRVRLRAINAAGNGPASESVLVTPSAPPDKPTSLIATPGDQSASIAFTAGADNGSTISNYEYKVDSGNWTALSPARTSSPVTIPGLTNGMEVSISLRAVNDAGTGASSDAVKVTPRTVPGAPTALTATAGDGQAQIGFTAPGDGGSAITNYEYKLDNGTWTALNPLDTTSPITISGLTNGTEYAVRLRAVNAAGSGASSDAVVVTPSKAPAAPTSLAATAGDESASIAFTPGSSNGAAITNYEYKLDSGNWTALSPADVSSPVTISGLTNGTTYTVRLRAVNSAGTGAASDPVSVTPRSVPGAPTALTATPGDEQVEITFTAGSTNGAAISNYEYKLDNGTWTALNPLDATSPVTITGLTNGTEYAVRLRAVNAAGSGAASDAVLVTPVTTAGAPGNLTPYPGDQQAVISFTPPTDTGGSAISNYQYQLGDGSWTTLDPADSSSPVTITGLTNGTQYSVRLRAVNAAGNGAASDPVTVTPRRIPGAPTGLDATPGDKQAVISFTAPASGGDPITGYEYQLDGGNWISAGTDASPVTITGLTNGVAYVVRLRTVNGAGNGPASDAVVVTPRTTPAAPTGLNATPGDGSAEISFTAGDDGGAAISNYQYSTNGGTNWTALSPADASSPVTVRGLTNGTTYQVLLRAVNDAGNGAASQPVSVTPRRMAGAPTNLSATPGDENASIAFTAPTDDGGSSITDYEYSLDGGAWTSAATKVSPVSVNSLTNGTEYAIRLRAVNASGPGVASTEVLVTPRTVPGVPTVTSLTPGDSTVEVLFNAPTDDGGAQITGYQYSTDGGTNWSSTVPALSGRLTITGLTNGTEYDVALRAVNAAGESTATASQKVTPRTTASAPTGLSATPGDGAAQIAFTTPTSNGGAAITNYEYQLDGGNWVALNPLDTTSPITVGGLTNGTQYRVRVRAVNAAGAGGESTSVVVTPRTVPAAPTSLAATPGDQSASIAFTPGADNGAPETNYEYKVDNGSWTALSPAQNSTPVSIPGLSNGTEVTIQLRAVNDAGAGAASDPVKVTPRTVPGTPTSLSATPGDQSASIAFTAPANGGDAIGNYEYKLDNGTWTALDPVDTATPVTISGLTNGTEYVVRLRAVNAAGNGPASDAVLVTPRTVPDAPTALQATPGDQSASIVFTPGADNGARVTNYEYQVDGGSWTALSPAVTGSPMSIPGLTNGTEVTIALRAVNAAGAGAASLPVKVTPRTVPGAPTALSATPGDEQASIAFTAPNNGGDAISDYEYKLDTGTWKSAGTNASPVTITNLTNGTEYAVRLRAVNAAGPGPASDAAIVTPRTTASAPTNLVATPGDQQAMIEFTAPASNGGSAITNYEYQLGNGTWTAVSPADKASPVFITGLANGTEYTVRLRAVNAVGSGAESDPVIVTPRRTAGAPTGLSATPSDQQAQIAFTAPDNGGDPITDYEYQLDGGTWKSAGTDASPVTITNLTNGTEYLVRLRTVNAAGPGPASDAVAVTPRTTPAAPTELTATPGDATADISFTAGNDGGATIRNYQYSTNGGTDWTALSPADTSSPVTVHGLTNGTTYQILLRAVNDGGDGAASDPVEVTPRRMAGAPTGLSATPGDQSASIAFTAPTDTGGTAITDYEYSIDNGQWKTAGTDTSPVTVSNLTNGTEYAIRLRAVNVTGPGVPSTEVLVTPRTVPDAPTALQATPGDQSASIAFTPGADNGARVTNYEYKLDTGTWTALSPAVTGSPVSIPGLANGTEVTIELRAVNAAGAGAASDPVKVTPRTVPGAPTALSATPGDEQASIAFTAPNNGGDAISDYEYKLDNGTWKSTGTNASPVTITNLTNGTEYAIRLRAVNAAGPGPASDALPVTPRTTADAPTALSAQAGDHSATISFTAPYNGGSKITNYEYSINTGTDWTALSPAEAISPVTVRGLDNGATYDVLLRAVNDAGPGAASQAVAVTPRTVPGAPSELSVTTGDGDVTVDFTAPDDGGDPIINYECKIDDDAWTAFDPAVTTSPVTISGLTNGTQYRLRLRAVNIAGNGAASDPVSFTPGTTTGQPTDLVAEPQDSAALVSFTPPESIGGSAIANYEYSLDGEKTWTPLAPASKTSPVTIPDLKNGTAYTVRLRAVNGRGAGQASDPVDVTPRTVPVAPTSLAAIPEDRSITLYFMPPADDGGAPISAYEYRLDSGAWLALPGQTTVPLTIPGLTNCVEYRVRLRAVNAAGPGSSSDSILVMPPGPRRQQTVDDERAKPPKTIAKDGKTVLTPRNLRTSSGERIRTRVQVNILGTTTQGEERYYTIIRGPQGKVAIKTYGHKNLRVVVLRTTPGTEVYRPYVERIVYLNGKKQPARR